MTKVPQTQSTYASGSLFKKRLGRFKQIKRGYYSFIIIVAIYTLSFFCPMLMNRKAIVVFYHGELYFPLLKFYPGEVFDQQVYGETDYRALKERFKLAGGKDWVLMPPYPYGPYESMTDVHAAIRPDDVRDRRRFLTTLIGADDPLTRNIVKQMPAELVAELESMPDTIKVRRGILERVLDNVNQHVMKGDLYAQGLIPDNLLSRSTLELAQNHPCGSKLRLLNRSILTDLWKGSFILDRRPPTVPTRYHWLGTDDRGRDVFVRLAYGYNISISFALVVVAFAYFVGISVGAALGYFGGKFDILAQRFIEIWATIPFLYTVIIISSILRPNFLLLTILLCMFGWMGMTFYMRSMFYREKARDYVQAAISVGASDTKVVFKHILPNALTPIITFGPFSIIGYIGSLVGLDYLGFGLPPPTPSWGELVNQGMGNIFSWWLVLGPLAALFITLLLVVFFGEALRQAFDPKEHSRLK